MIPTPQTCPQCGRRFIGSDVVGDPCFECLGFPVHVDSEMPDDVIEFRYPDGRVERLKVSE